MDLNALLGSGLIDPAAIGDRIFQQLQDRFASTEAFADLADKSPEELIATVLGDWVAGMIGSTGSSVLQNRRTSSDRDQERLYKELRDRNEELRDRNMALAAALGACGNCWGMRADCPACDGAGVPGWALPDEQLYAAYVRPAAVRAAANLHRSVAGRGPDVTN